MERVRKGAVANGKCKEWPEWKQDMLDHGVPDWYMWSCEKDQVHVPEGPCGGICYDGVAYRLV